MRLDGHESSAATPSSSEWCSPHDHARYSSALITRRRDGGGTAGSEPQMGGPAPDQCTLSIAQRSAKEKYGVHQTEMAHGELQHMILEQQLLYASLQAAVLLAPLYSNGQDMFEALHFNTHLGHDDDKREKQLLAHKERSVATLPSMVNNFTQMTINKVMAVQAKNRTKPVMQRLHAHFEYFISEIPHTSREDVDAAAMAYFDEISTSMKRHFNVHADRVRLNHVDSSLLYRRSTFKGSGIPATVNNIVCSVLTPSHGVVHFDAIMDDPLHPINLSSTSQFGVCRMTVTPRKDTVTGQTVSVTLRRMTPPCETISKSFDRF
ncbi:hypothetical protein PsorP6_001846 [Peronosclerospora sorghi]|uniref:Uncharacterized protein n=1 Tax=Peronosclerospora sorghi TaxID=230839 RepID=A0ACC0WTF6_9STRA|nr:hypothetical protein PsorP6_001846 [Peronosclerospora sorghi]